MTEISSSSIAVYLEARASKLEKSHNPPDTGVKDKFRGSSKAPVPGSAITWMDGAVGFARVVYDKSGKRYEECGRHENMKYLSYVHSIFEAYRDGRERHKGVPFANVANEVWHDPAAVSTWQDGRTEEARAMRKAWDALCHRIAVDFGNLCPDVSMFVELHPAEERREASELPQAAREDAGRTKREETAGKLRVIHLAWLGIKAKRGVGSEEAKRILHAEEGVHPKKTERAITMYGKSRNTA